MKPIIAIVGRPNVGKSTLFNRIVGRRQAIVNDTAGVTRDRHYANADWIGHEFTMIDTGGLIPKGMGIQAAIKKQTLMAMNEADVIICVFDGREGLVHLDRGIMEILRKCDRPVVYAVNKVENNRGLTPEFYEFGISKLFPVSAEHGIGVDDLLDEVVSELSPPPSPSPLEGEGRGEGARDVPRVAVIGRPNAGKSTLINHLVGNERLIAHEMPGTTRDSIDVEITADNKKYIFVDTAGLKKKGKTIETLDKFSAVKTLAAIERADVVLLIADANGGFTHQDSTLLDYAYSGGKGVIVVFNKWDELNTNPKELLKFYEEKLLPLHKVPFLYISAKTGLNTEGLFSEIVRVAHARNMRIPTAELNKLFEEIKEDHNIPSWRGKNVKIFYVTQVRTGPPEFAVFTNHPEGIPEGYKRYLMNRLQDVVGTGVPIRIKFKKK